MSKLTMADFSQMSDEQLAGCVSSAESGEAVAEMVSRYTGLVLALAGKYSGGADYEELVSCLLYTSDAADE